MSRPLRFEYPGALYHVTSRGERRENIFLSDADRLVWLALLAETCKRFQFVVHAYCLMGNHYHLVLTTANGRLAQGMRYLNATYSQYFNRQHRLVGHVFQGRYKAILCQRETYLQELARYVVLNPVRAGLVLHPLDWAWSSYRATAGVDDAPAWLDIATVLALFGAATDGASVEYKAFVMAGIGGQSPLRDVNCQLLLGDEAFCQRMGEQREEVILFEISRIQRQAVVPPLHAFFANGVSPKQGMAQAYLSLGYSMAEIARHQKVSVKTVSRAIEAHLKQAGRIDPDQS